MKKIKKISASLILISCAVFAAGLTDLLRDQQSQRVISLYGPSQNPSDIGGAIYNDGLFTIPNEMLCLLNQFWLPQLRDIGNFKFSADEQKCLGYDDGRLNYSGVANISTDNVSGDTVAKIWFYDPLDSLGGVAPRPVVTYMNVRVTSSPTGSEPYGRFIINAVDEDYSSSTVLSMTEVKANGDKFNVRGNNPSENNFRYSGYVDSVGKKGIYRFTSNSIPLRVVRMGYSDNYVCFEREGAPQNHCFPRSLSESVTNPNVRVNAFSYGIYNINGSRYTGPLGNLNIDNDQYTLTKFGGGLSRSDGQRPGGTSQFGSDNQFWTDKIVTMNGQQYKIQWLLKQHAVDLGAAVPLASLSNSSISLDANINQLELASSLTSTSAKSIGAFPIADFNSLPLKVKNGVIQ